jgi:hypothetical protein
MAGMGHETYTITTISIHYVYITLSIYSYCINDTDCILLVKIKNKSIHNKVRGSNITFHQYFYSDTRALNSIGSSSIK